MKKGFLSNGEHIDDVMTRLVRGIDEVLDSEIKGLTVDERLSIFKSISENFRDAEAF